jgi:DNA replicative helicase MCM subunit Mcm2 (Cdc46/Mcm family)
VNGSSILVYKVTDRALDIDTLVTVKGLMIRVSPIVPDMKQGETSMWHQDECSQYLAFFQCTVCDYTTVVETDHGHVEEPTLCGRTQCQQTNSMALVHNRSQFADRQVCRLQETPGEYEISRYKLLLIRNRLCSRRTNPSNCINVCLRRTSRCCQSW